MFMRRALMTALASAALGMATPAFAGITFTQYNGPNLTTFIHASPDNHTVAPDVGDTVYGNTNVHSGHDTTFQGFSYYNTSTDTGTATSISITGGTGFAQINDTDFNSKIPSTQNLFDIIMTPPAFSAYEFSIQLASDGIVNVFAMLTSQPGVWLPIDLGISQKANANTQYLLSSNPDVSISSVLIASNAPIFELKQNSINLFGATAVPEPGTWALMLLGFAGVGIALRRSRKRKPALMQIA
jgi:hypothetical protein